MAETGFEVPDRQTVVEQAVSDVTARVGPEGLITRGLAYITAIVVGGILHGCYNAVERLLRLVIWDTAGGTFLDRWAGLFQVYRLGEEYSVGIVNLTGSDGGYVPEGAELFRADGLRYRTVFDATISGGVGAIGIQALSGGSASDCETGVELTFAAVYSGVNSVAMVDHDAISGGRGGETDAELLLRLILRASETPQGGADADYEQWAKAYSSNIHRVWPYGQVPEAGDVLVLFTLKVDEETGDPLSVIPGGAEVTALQGELDSKAPMTADVTVTAPSALEVDMTITLSPNDDAVKDAVTAEVDALFQDDGAPASTIYNSQLRGAIDRATGESHHTLDALTIGGTPAGVLDDIVIGQYEVPVRGTITWG